MCHRLSGGIYPNVFYEDSMNKKELDIFKNEVRKWATNLGLKDWGISVEMDELESDRVAECQYENHNRYAIITIDSAIEKPSRKSLELTAIHETLELVMADIREALCAFYNAEMVDKQVHRVIRTLENALK